MNERNQYSLLRSSLSVSLVMLLAKFVSYGRDLLLAHTLGATELSDAFLLSTSLLLTITTFFNAPFAAAYLPLATDAYYKRDEEGKARFFGSVYGAALVLGLILLALIAVLLKPLLPFLVPGFSANARGILQTMMLIQLPVMVIALLNCVNNGNLKLLGQFGVSELSSSIIAFITILYLLFWHNSISAEGLSLSVVAAYGSAFLLGYVVIYRAGLRYQWSFRFKGNQDLKEIFTSMLPFMLASGAKELNTLIDRMVASLLTPGSITIQTYASKLTVTEVGLIATAISLVIYAKIAKDNTLQDLDSMRQTVVTGLTFVNTLMFPCCIFTIVFRTEIISFLFGHGAFTAEDVRLTANTMMIYAVGMIGAGIEDILTRTMHATKYRKYPALVSTISVFANTILNLLLYKPFGVYGLAAASSFVFLLKIPFYAVYVQKHIIAIRREDRLLEQTAAIFAVSLLAGAGGYGAKTALALVTVDPLIILCAGGVVGGMIFLIGGLLVHNEYVTMAFNRFRKR